MEADEPDLKFEGLSLWVLGQFPDHNEYWDGNWLNVRVRVETRAAVETCGPIPLWSNTKVRD